MEIRGNGQFLLQASIRGWPGAGTEEDPFIIENWWFDLAPGGSDHYGSPALLIKDVTLHFSIRSCTFGHEKEDDEDYTWYVLMIYNSTHATLEDNTIWGNIHRGLALINSPSLTLKGTRVMEGSIILRSESFENYTGYLVEDNLVKGQPYEFIFNRTGDTIAGRSGKFTIAYSDRFMVRDLDAEDLDSAVELIHCNNFTMEDSQFLRCSVAGILTSGCSDLVMRDNNFEDCGLNGILMEDTTDTVIELNSISRSEEDGIYGTGGGRNTIRNNEIRDCTNAGIWLIEEVSSRIIANDVSDCWGEGIMLEDSIECSIDGNDCLNIKGPGMRLLGTSNSAVERNTVAWDLWSRDYYDGIYLEDSLNNSINNNTVTGIPDAGMLMRNSSGNSVKDNWMVGNDGAGIVANYGSNENLFTYNVLMHNEGGIYLQGLSVDNVIHHNDIANISGSEAYDGNNANQWWDGVGEGNHWSSHLQKFPQATSSDMVTWNEDHSIDTATSSNAKDPYPMIFPVNLEGEGFLDATRDREAESGAEILFRCMIKDSGGIEGPKVNIGSRSGNLTGESTDLVLGDDGFWSALYKIPWNFAGWLEYGYAYSRGSVDLVHGPFDVFVVDDEDPVADGGDDIVTEVGRPFTLNGSRSTDNIGIVRYIWDLGYGFPDLEGEVVEYTINTETSREITLTVIDEEGNRDTNRVHIRVTRDWFDAVIGPVLDAETGDLLEDARVELSVEYNYEEEWSDRNGICYFSLPPEFKGKSVNATVHREGYNSLSFRFNVSWEGEVDIGEIRLRAIEEGRYGLEEDNGAGPVFALVLFLVLLFLFIAIVVLSIRSIPRGSTEDPSERTPYQGAG
ncbi:MAG: right-handed parallel beta-helix repeat-containing protein [Thermoplasmatota archaeon]